jgi:predicted ATPase/signal transduction histidine kinase
VFDWPPVANLPFRRGIINCWIPWIHGPASEIKPKVSRGAPGLVSNLSSYAFSALRHGDLTLYRGSAQELPPILLATAENASPACLNRLEHEYTLRADLDAAWAAQPLELSRHRNRLALVLGDPGGTILERLLDRPLGVTEFLRIAISLAGALRQAHAHGLIHKDIKPANILVDLANGGVWLTGFGIASRLPRERADPGPPEEIAGTLAYMAPEQTGRMNRSIDARSDLYSLGVTFYEMLTGTLPFAAADPMEWVHCHIARQPVPPNERIVAAPAALSDITMKLLAKTVEARYQTAAGVEADLRRSLAQWERDGRIDTFPLGARDISDRLLIPEKLYGREREIETLLARFDDVVAHGTTELVLVSGYSGIGKSSVVHELHKVLVQPRGLYAAGKFDQYKRDIPYATLAQAFQNLVHSLLSQGEMELGRWRDSFTEALGSNGQLIVNLVPELELIVGKQPALADLPPQEARNRFQLVFRRFLGVFAHEEHPLALFLDDLQWMDSATLDLLEHLVTHSEVRHLLLVGAYRDNEVGPTHSLSRTLQAILDAHSRVYEIVLAPLGLGDVGRLMADTLHCEPERAQALTELVYEKTGGNPFFAIQFLIALADESLIAFDSAAAVWTWDIDRIHAKNYTDNVVDFMVRKLKRLSIATQDALKQLACLGNLADLGKLALIQNDTEEAVRERLWEAVHTGLLAQRGDAYQFLHDRIQQAAYSLIPEEHRAEVHLRIGRKLMPSLAAKELAEQLFEVASHFNRGGALIVDRDERAQVAAIDLRAGQKAKASAAYASARAYLASGMLLLDEQDWSLQYQLVFSLWLERAQCELLCGNFEMAEQLVAQLLQRTASKADQAAVYDLNVRLHTVRGEYPQALDKALACLRLFGVDLPAHPSWDAVVAEYQTIWRNLDGRPIETLLDLPRMTDPDLQAAMLVFSILTEITWFTEFHLHCMLVCRTVNMSMQYGVTGASAHAYASLGALLGPLFHRYHEGYRLGRLACDLVEKHDLSAYYMKVHHEMGGTIVWTQPLTSGIELRREVARTATETGDVTFACYDMHHTITDLLLRNDPLEAVWRESEMALDFARKAQFRDVVDLIVSQQRFVAAMQGRTAAISTFNDVQFDESAFEAKLTGDRMATMICVYWILKLKARFLSGDYVEALAAATTVKPMLRGEFVQIFFLDYCYYTALTVAALYENASADEQHEWHSLLTAHREQLREWAEVYPPTFGDKYALVAGEIARLEGRDAEAMRLYDQAIKSAHEHGFVQNEALAHEVGAAFYAARGVEGVTQTYLHNARRCYLHWGAFGKVRQLDERHPGLREEPAPSTLSGTVSAPIEQLDVGTVVKASQAVSSELELGKLIETLMRISLEHAAAERGLLILFRGNEPRIAAQATTGGSKIEVTLQNSAVTPTELSASVLHTAIRTQDSVILDDASAQTPFSRDGYVREKQARSVLCLPLVKQGRLVGALYLENNLAPRVFTSAKLAVLELLASQAAISLENVQLYDELRRGETYLSEAQRLSHTGSFAWRPASGEIYWTEETFRIFEYDPSTTPTLELLQLRIHPDDVAAFRRFSEQVSEDAQDFAHEYRLQMPDERIKYIHVVARALQSETGTVEFVGAVMDVSAIRLAERELHKTRTDLAHVTRVTSLGELTASIAHEVNQPLGAVMFNAEACMSWLNGHPPNMDEAHAALQRIVRDSTRAGEVIRRIRALAKKTDTKMAPLDLDDVLNESLAFVQHELSSSRVALRVERASMLPVVLADKVQIQQVILNLVMNGIEAMQPITDRQRELVIRSEQDDEQQVQVTVTDCGVGFPADSADRLFNTFFTTKSSGMGMGLSICRSIIELHGGRIWAVPNIPHGAIIRFTLPLHQEAPAR